MQYHDLNSGYYDSESKKMLIRPHLKWLQMISMVPKASTMHKHWCYELYFDPVDINIIKTNHLH